jgi:DNA-binding beta-propeller fold protein YncE
MNRKDIHKRYLNFVSFFLLLFICACAPKLPVPDKPTGEYMWPPPPEIPRIKWLTQWSGSHDLKGINPLDVLIKEATIHVLFRPNGVVADNAGNVYVADSQLRKIFVFDVEKKNLRFLGEELLQAPTGLALDNKRGIIFVADSVINKVFCLNKNTGRAVFALETTGAFHSPSGMVYDEDQERLYVSDTKNHVVRTFDKDGKALFTIGAMGRDEGDFQTPTYLALDRNGRLYVVDTFNSRVQIFDREGKFVKKFGKIGNSPGSFAMPAGISVDSEGHIYVADAAFNNFQIFDDEGRLLLWIGKAGSGAGEFQVPSGMYIDKEDRIYVSDTFNRRVQVFQYLKEKK